MPEKLKPSDAFTVVMKPVRISAQDFVELIEKLTNTDHEIVIVNDGYRFTGLKDISENSAMLVGEPKIYFGNLTATIEKSKVEIETWATELPNAEKIFAKNLKMELAVHTNNALVFTNRFANFTYGIAFIFFALITIIGPFINYEKISQTIPSSSAAKFLIPISLVTILLITTNSYLKRRNPVFINTRETFLQREGDKIIGAIIGGSAVAIIALLLKTYIF